LALEFVWIVHRHPSDSLANAFKGRRGAAALRASSSARSGTAVAQAAGRQDGGLKRPARRPEGVTVDKRAALAQRRRRHREERSDDAIQG
jgi:hypothetical protein